MKQELESMFKSIGHFIISPNEVFERPAQRIRVKKAV